MKLVLIINNLGGGGAERIACSLLSHFTVKNGYDCSVILLDDNECTYKLDDRIRIERLFIGRLIPGPLRVLGTPLLALELALRLRRRRVDIALSFLVRSNLTLALTKSFGFDRPVVISERVRTSSHYSSKSITGSLMLKLIQWVYPLADKVIAISEGVRSGLLELGLKPEKVITIHNPQDVKKIQQLADLPAVFDWNETFSLVTSGRIVPQKDYPTLLHAMHRICKVRNDVRLVIMGEGPLRETMEAMATDLGIETKLTWLGFVENPFSVLKRCSVFVFSSAYEGFGNVLVEAMACGLPVVSTDCPSGPAEILDAGRFGVLVEVGDDAALAQEVLALLNQQERRKLLSESGKARAMEFDLPAVAERYRDVIMKLINTYAASSKAG